LPEPASSEPFVRLRLPNKKDLEMFGIAIQLHGGDQIKVACEDGKERMCRIPGKLKKRVWIREGDIVIIKLWDFQPIKADIVWRYLGMQVERLEREGYLKNLPR
jgi:translation initiation factor 1A